MGRTINLQIINKKNVVLHGEELIKGKWEIKEMETGERANALLGARVLLRNWDEDVYNYGVELNMYRVSFLFPFISHPALRFW